MTCIRSDLVDLYLFRRSGALVEFLQLRRVGGSLDGTWHPIMGHLEPAETAADAVRREMHEEVGLAADNDALLGLWGLQGVHPYFLHARDAVMLTPRFAGEVRPDWTPTLNDEHDAHRWVPAARVRDMFLWPGQWAACAEVMDLIISGGPAADALRLRPINRPHNAT
jgi:8-oxo-dGTP pyrophosphatase MutT (NUDIX family)